MWNVQFADQGQGACITVVCQQHGVAVIALQGQANWYRHTLVIALQGQDNWYRRTLHSPAKTGKLVQAHVAITALHRQEIGTGTHCCHGPVIAGKVIQAHAAVMALL